MLFSILLFRFTQFLLLFFKGVSSRFAFLVFLNRGLLYRQRIILTLFIHISLMINVPFFLTDVFSYFSAGTPR